MSKITSHLEPYSSVNPQSIRTRVRGDPAPCAGPGIRLRFQSRIAAPKARRRWRPTPAEPANFGHPRMARAVHSRPEVARRAALKTEPSRRA
jgi:hypothetical protein